MTPTPPPTGLALTLGPNPARTTATAWFDADGGPATVEVFDALGRRVATAFEGEASGRVSVSLPVAGLPPGVYLVRVTVGRRVESARLVIAR
jgi:hypothetical protein